MGIVHPENDRKETAMSPTRTRLTAAALAALMLTLAPGGRGAFASSHREAPFITKNPKVDATDFYMFRSYEPGRDGYVTLIANYFPLQDAYGGPHYFPLHDQPHYARPTAPKRDGR